MKVVLREDVEKLGLRGEVVDVARGLSKQVVAEWVEAPDALKLLQEMGAQYGQGFMFRKPVPSALTMNISTVPCSPAPPKAICFPSADHIGQASLPPPASPKRSYVGAGASRFRTSHSSLSSMCECPLRHHCPDTVPRAVIISVRPSGDGAAQYSLA